MKQKRKRNADYPHYPPPTAMKENKPPLHEVWYPDLPGLGESWKGIAIRFLFFVILLIIILGVLEYNRL